MEDLFDNDGFFIHRKPPTEKIIKRLIRKTEAKEKYNYHESELVIIEEQEEKKIPNLKTQKSNEIFHLKDTSVINGYAISNIERTLKVNKITKIDDFGNEYNYFENIYTYCFDLVHKGKFIEYYEIIAKDVPELRKKVKLLLHKSKI